MAKKKLLSGNGWSFEPAAAKQAPEPASLPDASQKARIRLEKRAKGKEVTLISGFVLCDRDRKDLAAALKKTCGAGGADSAEAIEIQGDHREAAARFLTVKGWKVK